MTDRTTTPRKDHPTRPTHTVGVDSGHLIILDPCHLHPDGLDFLAHLFDMRCAVLIQTQTGDGIYPVVHRHADDTTPGHVAIVPVSHEDDLHLLTPRQVRHYLARRRKLAAEQAERLDDEGGEQ